MRPTLVVLSGAGMSAESGIKTFRDSGGLWESYDVMQVASYEGWLSDQMLVLEFYNQRRQQLEKASPNQGHTGLVSLEEHYNVQIITQNVDNLHERAGSKNILHLHGELTKARSTVDDRLVYDIGYRDIKPGDTCEKGSQLRPHIVWFGEEVPMMDQAIDIAAKADIFVIIGTSLNVYPAASLLHYVPENIPVYLIDPNEVVLASKRHIQLIKMGSGAGVQHLIELLTQPIKQ